MKNMFCVLLLSMVQPVLAQTKLEKAITNLENNYEQEKVYVLTDKSQYAAGDKIWFKSFVFDGYNRSALSTTLFVELYNSDKKLIDWKTILLTNGEGSGDFQLKEDLPEQVYFVRAYTPYMTNFNEDFQIVKTIPVYNPNSLESLVIAKSSDWSAKVFPEGGTFINGMPTKFAVRLSSNSSLPENWSGKIIDSQNPNTAVTTFKSFDKNVTSFKITPASGKKYQAIIQDNTGKSQTIDLPQVADSGLNIEVSSSKEGIKYNLKGVNLKQQLQGYKIIGLINNHLAYRANINHLTNEASSLIPTKISNGANGILQLVIFDEQDNVAAQRLCFIKPGNLKIEKAEIVGQSLKTTPRAFNSIDLSPESYFKNYTVLVSEDNGAQTPEADNILSALWLTGDFTTRIDSPAQYFSKNTNTEALDALLISENWKRFDWSSVLSGTAPIIKTPSQKYLSYRVKPIKNNALLPNTNVNLLAKSGQNQPAFSQFKTDQNGYIYLNNLNNDEPLEITAFVNSEDKESGNDDLYVTIEPLVTPSQFKGNFPATQYTLVKTDKNKNLPSTISRAINTQKNIKKKESNDIQIQAIALVGKKKDPKAELEKQLSSGMFSSLNSTVFDFVNEDQHISGSSNILDWLQGRAAGLTFQKNNSGASVPYIRGQQAKLFLDEIPTDPTMISSLPVNNIAMVKIIKGSGLIGDAVAIYTMKGNMKSKSNEKETRKNNSSIIKGYDKPSEFPIEMIDDDAPEKIENDTRETLYWNPNLFDSDYVPPRIKFFNNDSAKQYKVLIISFDEDDNLLYDQQVLQ
ncbi:TonB-dependent receptor-like protein [Chryseobacterium sp. CBTAP 102]|uniref:TonB-dependent receptor plug domain-containing protein n=1 Tax=Chryseobacterium sp. CBTAP 102 TaxID=2135644 RepID=UPI000D7605FF|nr:TonB-dependent receptor plug domain-containing protein [Chryseobacterium sp. CBTAP 102]PXW16256.1 TonB-dependent receptor-like protein [Chryseobacterium sp. CBTAP 102]